MEVWKGVSVGVCKVRGAMLVSAVSLGLLCFWCGDALASSPFISPLREYIPFVQVEEFVPGASSVSAEFYAFMFDLPPVKSTTSTLQYVDAADYDPTAADPYATGVTLSFGVSLGRQAELHARLALAPNVVYHYRILASNADGSFETADQTFQTYPPSEGSLPDGRAYEQVSPTAKNNLDALGSGEYMAMQASPSSSAPAFAFFSVEPFPVAVGTSILYTEYLSTRSSSPAAAWATQSVQAPTEPLVGESNEASGFTEDLAKAIVAVTGPPLSPPGVTNAYVRDNATGSYQLLAPNIGNVSQDPLLFVDATRDDSRILFETVQQLLPAAAVGVDNLYEWDEAKPEGERLSLAGVLTDGECAALSKPSGCAPPNGSGAGVGGGEFTSPSGLGYLQNTISEDGSKVFFTAHPSGRIYEREPLSKPSPATVAVSPGPATFLAAIPSGRYVFYTEGAEMYRFDTASETRQALSSGAEGILGSLGVSDDGSYAYFVANGVLAANQNTNGEQATKGAPNLYEWHEDTSTHTSVTTFVARLLPEDLTDVLAAPGNSFGEEGKTSRVNPSGTALLFMSGGSLTGYDSGHHAELFLYDAEEPLSGVNPVCVSCSPSGAVAVAQAHLAQGGMRGASVTGPIWTPHLTRNLSASGDRVFFETAEALVPGDTNNVSDVYEWEREGVGSCSSGEGHCLYLISSGTAHAKSFFGDASASGEDAYFFTRQSLIGQDADVNFDVYDARAGGGIPAQNPSVTHCEGEGCKPPPSSTPVVGAPGSSTLTGLGSIGIGSPYKVIKCARGKKLNHGRCIREKIKCAKGRKLSHGKCVKAKNKGNVRSKKSKARKAARPGDGGSK
jgi:hypothetical protein